MDEQQAMARAAVLAARAVRTSPNPKVGCVLLARDGTVVGEGWHHGPGQPHAEVEALRAAGPAARGATAVVTLEPCDHTGRTGPCTAALIGAGIARVVYGRTDPNPTAAGGAATLAAAGIAVELLPAPDLNPDWEKAVALGRPVVVWKAAATLDGRVAAADGTSRWITGPQARRQVHELRAELDAVVVGTGTVLADDPHLGVRLPDRPDAPQPLRVVVGTRPVPADARVRSDGGPTLQIPDHDPKAVLARLWDEGVRSVLLEGGPRLAAAFLAAGLVDASSGTRPPRCWATGRRRCPRSAPPPSRRRGASPSPACSRSATTSASTSRGPRAAPGGADVHRHRGGARRGRGRRPARADAARLTLRGPLVTGDARPGDSIAVNGVVPDGGGRRATGAFTADVMPRRSTAPPWARWRRATR